MKHSKANKLLTPRENAVLWLLIEGLSNKEIADRLGISEFTVKFHLRNSGEKIGTTSRTKIAVDFVLGQGLAELARSAPASARSECAERRAKLLEDNWIGGFSVALAQVHRHGGGSTVVCGAARDAGLTLADARGAGVSTYDLEELERAGLTLAQPEQKAGQARIP